MPLPKNVPPSHASEEPTVAELWAALRERDARIDRLVAALDRMVEVAGAAPSPPPSPAPVDTVTVAELWTRYVQTLPEKQRWVYNVVSMMTPTLEHFAPSVVTPRKRRGRFPARRAIQGPEMLISSLRPHHWSDWRDWMRVHQKNGATYRNLILKRLKALLNWGANEKRIAENPLAGAKTEPKQPRRETTISELDLQRILESNPSPAFRAHLLISVDTGMRTDEARRLTWDQIDMLTGRVKLSWTTTKSRKSRVVKLMPRDLLALRELPRYEHSRFVFARATKDKPYSQARFWSWFRAAADAIGVQCAPGDSRIHFHDATRHSFATEFLRLGGRLNQLKTLLGHASIQTTALYEHTTAEDLEAAHHLLTAAHRKDAHDIKPPKDDE